MSASLDTALKSVVAYGENGAGKSSFVDAVEFLMSGGKIRHLAHEYSGKHQEKGIINTHTYETPNIGIRWSAKTSTFDDARAQLKDRPDSAGNDVRKIMDIELALIADKLQIRMPYLRGERNDRRMAHDFLERFIADGGNCFQKKGAKDYETHNEAIESFKRADQLLLSWANQASHSFDLVRPEATKLIDACEQALGFFRCPSCGKVIAFADAEAKEWTQCQCGSIRWRYGKG